MTKIQMQVWQRLRKRIHTLNTYVSLGYLSVYQILAWHAFLQKAENQQPVTADTHINTHYTHSGFNPG